MPTDKNTTDKNAIKDFIKKISTKGGYATFAKYGTEHYKKMGKKSAESRRKNKLHVL